MPSYVRAGIRKCARIRALSSVAMIYAFSQSKTITEIAEYEANPKNHQVACLRHTERISPSISRGIATLVLGAP